MLPYPIKSTHITRRRVPGLRVAVAACHGYRLEQQDRFAFRHVAASDTIAAMVCDGHGGTFAAEYVTKHLTDAILDGVSEPFVPATKTAAQITDACVKTDAALCKDVGGVSSGTTMALALVRCINEGKSDAEDAKMVTEPTRRYALTTAHVGDSRVIVLDAERKVKYATKDHGTTNTEEISRIVKRSGAGVFSRHFGGCVRYRGDINMTRVFGDAGLKTTKDRAWAEQDVAAVPDMAFVELLPGDLILIASDGLFENGCYISDTLAREVAFLEMCNSNGTSKTASDLGKIAHQILMRNLNRIPSMRNCHDNQTLVIIECRHSDAKEPEYEFCPGRLECAKWFPQYSFGDENMLRLYISDAIRWNPDAASMTPWQALVALGAFKVGETKTAAATHFKSLLSALPFGGDKYRDGDDNDDDGLSTSDDDDDDGVDDFGVEGGGVQSGATETKTVARSRCQKRASKRRVQHLQLMDMARALGHFISLSDARDDALDQIVHLFDHGCLRKDQAKDEVVPVPVPREPTGTITSLARERKLRRRDQTKRYRWLTKRTGPFLEFIKQLPGKSLQERLSFFFLCRPRG